MKEIAVPIGGAALFLGLGGWGLNEVVDHGQQLAQVEERQQAIEERFDEYIQQREQADARQDTYNERVLEVLDRVTQPTPTPR
jgi:hypothetical protein